MGKLTPESVRFVIILFIIVISVSITIFLERNPLLVFIASVNAAMPLIPLSLAAAVVISSGDIDLSTAGQFSIYGTLYLLANSMYIDPILSILIIALFSVTIGLIQGWIIARQGLTPLVTTISVSFILIGLSSYIDAEILDWAISSPGIDVHRTLTSDYLLPAFKYSWPWTLIVVIGLIYWRYYTQSGLQHIAVGANRESAERVGLRVSKIRQVAFLLAAVLALSSTILFLIDYREGAWSPVTGTGKELIAIAAAVIGGTRIQGGRLVPMNVAAATVLIASLKQLATASPYDPTLYYAFVGGAVLVVAVFEQLVARSGRAI